MEARKVYILHPETKKLVEVFRVHREPVAPYIRCDTIDEYCHGTGVRYTSRAERNLDLKMHGIEPVTENEYQNIRQKEWIPKEKRELEVKDSLEKSYYDIRDSREQGLPEQEKILCKEIDAQLRTKP